MNAYSQSGSKARMKPWTALALYLVALVLFSGLASPWLFRIFQALASHDALIWLKEVDFEAVLNHLLILSAMAGAVILLASQRSLSLRVVGLAGSPNGRAHVLLGLLVATASVVAVLLVGLRSDVFSWDTRIPTTRIVIVSVITAFGAALLALSEEFFFRGCLLGWLEQHVSRVVALIAVTLFFAICHFLGGAKSPSVDEISWLSGFQMLSQYAGRLAADAHWVPQFLMLALVGLTLGWCRLQTSTLYLSIGLHAGWVFSGKMLFVVTNINRATPNWWFGHGKLLGSPISIAAVGSVLVLMVWVGKRLRARDVVHSAPLAGASEA